MLFRSQLLQIFVILHPHPLSNICPSPCHEIPLKYYIYGDGNVSSHLEQKFRDEHSPRICLSPLQIPVTSSCNTIFISSLTDRPRTGLLGHRPSLLNLNSTSGINWSPQYPFKILLFDSSGENEDFDILVLFPLCSCFVGLNPNNTCLLP